jgi:hypothetical protein
MRFAILPLLALLILPLSTAATSVPAANAVWTDANGDAHLGVFTYTGSCNGAGTATLALVGGPTWSVSVASTSVTGECGQGMRCLDCPPVPSAYAWTLKGNGVLLAGGGPSAYYQYQTSAVAYALAGEFLGGALVAEDHI